MLVFLETFSELHKNALAYDSHISDSTSACVELSVPEQENVELNFYLRIQTTGSECQLRRRF